MKTRIAFIALALLTAFASLAEDAPKTPAGDALAAWIESFNTHDVAARKEFLKTHTALDEEQIEEYAPRDVEFREEHGAFEIVKVTKSTDTSITAQLRHKGSGASPTIELSVETEAPHRITGLGLKM
jgi:hypothetical protein